jgi:DNA polymerase/3'-5' exonuclease PolX
VGVGLPQLCVERDLICDYFQQQNATGFEYAYTFPGMNRVLQGVGRVIRSEIGLDFFAADQLNFWTMLVCRTGSMESNTRVASAAIKLGQTWNMYRGFEDRVTGELLFVPDSEEAVFAHVGLPYRPPKDRA